MVIGSCSGAWQHSTSLKVDGQKLSSIDIFWMAGKKCGFFQMLYPEHQSIMVAIMYKNDNMSA